jgi:hypothetical protein
MKGGKLNRLIGDEITMEWDYSKSWYHGSPLELEEIRKGSTITQDRDLARVFSHKPTLVSISDDGSIKHNGKERGFLYRIAETVRAGDVHPHPQTSVEYGKEWLTNRNLKVMLICPTQILDGERLTDEEVKGLLAKSREL